MSKLVLDNVSSGYASATRLNSNNDAIEAAVEKTLSRDGTSPNEMAAVLDMNSNRVINVGAPTNDNDAVRLIDIVDAVTGGTVIPSQAGNAYKYLRTTGLTSSWTRANDVYDIRTYGAVAGGTGNQTAVQAAIDAAEATGGGTVLVPDGVFYVNTALHQRANVRLVGNGYNSVLKWANGINFSDNMVKFETISNASIENLRVDGNRTNVAGGTQYGIYFGSATHCKVIGVHAHSTTGDGLHIYNSDGCVIANNFSYDNFFHGAELEQTRNSTFIGNVLNANLRNGLYVFEGEVAASGSRGLTIIGNTSYSNTQNGCVIQGPLTRFITFSGNILRANGNYGVALFDQVQAIKCTGNVVESNGYTGIYLWRAQYCSVTGNILVNNSQAANGGHQEIFLEGDATQYAKYNVVQDNIVIINGATKAAYGIKENSSNDSPNIIRNNVVPLAGTAGTIAPISETSMRFCKGNIGREDENRGTSTFNGTGAQVAFVIAHGLTPDAPRVVSVTAGSPNAAGDFSVASDATNITITYLVAPTTGTGNVILRWSVST